MQPGITLNPRQTVADLVLEHSACAQVFQKNDIDFCCRGDVSIEEAARAKGLALPVLLGELTRAIEQRGEGRTQDLRETSTPELVSHIVATHHEYLRQALPMIGGLAAKVCRVHGAHNPKLHDLNTAVQKIAPMLIGHLDDEELNLFPALSGKQPEPAKISEQLANMYDEHLAVSKLLERIRVASDNFEVPAWGCNSYRTLFSELRRLESDIFTHVHLENHVLKPRFVPGAAQ